MKIPRSDEHSVSISFSLVSCLTDLEPNPDFSSIDCEAQLILSITNNEENQLDQETQREKEEKTFFFFSTNKRSEMRVKRLSSLTLCHRA